MRTQDEARLLRHRFRELAVAVDRLDARDAPAGGQAIVLRTKSEGSYPTVGGRFFACSIVGLGGVEEEGATVELTAIAATVYALNVGSKLPPEGTEVVAIVQDGRFAFQFDGDES